MNEWMLYCFCENFKSAPKMDTNDATNLATAVISFVTPSLNVSIYLEIHSKGHYIISSLPAVLDPKSHHFSVAK